MNTNVPLSRRWALPFTKAADPEKRHELDDTAAMRLPFAKRLPDNVRNHFVAMCGEFVGTVLFLYFALGGTQVANNIHTSSGSTIEETGSNPQQLQYIALSFGFSLAVNAWVFFRISGGLFNPAVTLGMCLIGALPWVRGALLIFVQILGGIVAAALVSCMFPGPLAVRTSLSGGTSVAQGLFIEMMLTAELIFTIFMLAAEKHKSTFIAPIGIGLSLFVAELVGVYYTGGSLNPARSFGPCVVLGSFHGYHWLYWLGPVLGALLASGFYWFIKVLEYETANPDQDTDKSKVLPQHNHHAAVNASPNDLVPSSTNDRNGVMTNGVGNDHSYGKFASQQAPPFSNSAASSGLHPGFPHIQPGPVAASPAMQTSGQVYGEEPQDMQVASSPAMGVVGRDGMVRRNTGNRQV